MYILSDISHPSKNFVYKMAHESAKVPTANVKDGENESVDPDLEEGEIEDEDEGASLAISSVTAESTVKPDVSPPKPNVIKEENTTPLRTTKRWSNRTQSMIPHRFIEQPKEEEPEDDWMGDVEKALKAALMRDKVTVANDCIQDKDNGSPEKKKRKKDTKGEDVKVAEESSNIKKDVKKRQKNELEENEEVDDEDEMLFVRGASPVRKNVYPESESSPHRYADAAYSGPYDESYESYNDEDSDLEKHEDYDRHLRDGDSMKRGLGRGIKRRLRGALGGRGLVHKRLVRKEIIKGKVRGKGRLPVSRGLMERGTDSLCMFYMQGKCQKGDDCPYSHDALPPRKMELCKFYLMDCCAKKEKCLYMHQNFPCKFYHTGMTCFSGNRCKFSHSQLSDTTRTVLMKHLETAPKEILGDFPRLSHESGNSVGSHKKSRGGKAPTKKIPSLFEIEVPIPKQLLSKEGSDENSPPRRCTPMPDSDSEEFDSTRTSPASPKGESKSPKKKSHTKNTSDREYEEIRSERKHAYDSKDFAEQLKEIKPMLRFYQETLSSDESDYKKHEKQSKHDKVSKRRSDESRSAKKTNEKRSKHSEDNSRSKRSEEGSNKKSDDLQSMARNKQEMNLLKLAGYINDQSEHGDKIECDQKAEVKLEVEKSRFNKQKNEEIERTTEVNRESVATESGNESNDGINIPLHLPKKQRELFLRIQQQQREAETSEEKGSKNEDDDENCQDENWYSSDDEEESSSLTDILKKLSKQTQQQEEPPSVVPENQPTLLPGLKLADLSKIDISESVTKLLSSIRSQGSVLPKQQSISPISATEKQPSTQSPQARDPRLSRDPRNRVTVDNTTSTSSLSSPSSAESVHPRRSDPRKVNDPRAKFRGTGDDEKYNHRSSGSSASSNSTPIPNIYSNAITTSNITVAPDSLKQYAGHILQTTSDMDFRNLLSKTDLETSDVDFRTITGLKADTDLRSLRPSAYLYGDTDLRTSIESAVKHDLSDKSNSDVDFRKILGLDLPFKPVPNHTPATEIEASLTSHPPIHYKVVEVTIPRPDYTNLKLSMSDPQVQTDPRLRKIFRITSPTRSPTTSSSSSTTTTLITTTTTTIAAITASTTTETTAAATPSRPVPGSSLVITTIPTAIATITTTTTTPTRTDPRRQAARNINTIPADPTTTIRFPTSPNEMMINPNAMMMQVGFPQGMMQMPMQNALLPNPILQNPNAMMQPQNPMIRNQPSLLQTPNAVMQNFDPRIARNPRNAPGLLGAAPANFCPPTPYFDDPEEKINMDNDPRTFYSNPMSVNWEHQQPRNWRGGRRKGPFDDTNQRSFTPPL